MVFTGASGQGGGGATVTGVGVSVRGAVLEARLLHPSWE